MSASPPLPAFGARPTSPIFDGHRRRRQAMAQADNTSQALRLTSPTRSQEVAGWLPVAQAPAGRPGGPLPAGGPRPALPRAMARLGETACGPVDLLAWWRRAGEHLPLQLVPLMQSLPALLNNLRHAERSMAWWRFFAELLDKLEADIALATQQAPAAGAPAALAEAVAAWRWRRLQERTTLRMALCEARFNLSFNAIELLTYVAGLVPVLGQLLRLGSGFTRLFARAVPWLLLCSGLLHVVQRAVWLSLAVSVRHAVREQWQLQGLLAAHRDALLGDVNAAYRFHATQVALWSAFCVGLLTAAGLGTWVGVPALWGGALAAGSMVLAKLQRFVSPARLEVPDSLLWHVDEGLNALPSLHQFRVFGAARVQAEALTHYQRQADILADTLQRYLVRHHGPFAGFFISCLLQLGNVAGVAPLLGLLCGRLDAASELTVCRTWLVGYRAFWAAEQDMVSQETAQLAAEQHALGTALAAYDFPYVAPEMAKLCRRVTDEQAFLQEALAFEGARLRALVAGADRWLLQADGQAAEVWQALQETWQLDQEPPRPAAARPPLAAILLAARTQMQARTVSLLWASKLGRLGSAGAVPLNAPALATPPW